MKYRRLTIGRIAAGFMICSGCVGVIVGCGSDAGGSNPIAGQAVPAVDSGSVPGDSGGSAFAQTTTVRVSTAGGTVVDPSGNTTLVIPGGALAQDTDITLSIVPKYGTAVVEVSDFGPDGLTFSKPVTLSIKADSAAASQGESLSIAVNDGADLKSIDGSVFANGTATASITHFSRYTVIVVSGSIEACFEPKRSSIAQSEPVTCGSYVTEPDTRQGDGETCASSDQCQSVCCECPGRDPKTLKKISFCECGKCVVKQDLCMRPIEFGGVPSGACD